MKYIYGRLIDNCKNKLKEENMKKNFFKSVGWFFSIMLVAGLIVSLGTGGESFAKDPIKIGYIGTFSTPWGKTDKFALEESVKELNAAGGILGRPVELVMADTKGEVPLAVAAYKKLVMNDKCLLVFTEGTEGTMGCAEVASRLYPSYPHIQFSVFASSPIVSDLVATQYNKYKFLFRPYYNVLNTYTGENKLHIDTLKGTMGTKKLALVIEDATWTELYRKGLPGVVPTMKDFYEKNGLPVVYYQTTDIKEKMFFPIFEKIAASGADSIYFVGAYTDTIGVAKQWAQSPAKNIDFMLMGGASAYEAFWQMTGGQALGVVSHQAEIDVPYTVGTVPLLKKMKGMGVSVSMGSGPGCYDGPWIFKKAVETVGNVNDFNAIIKALEKNEVQHKFWTWAFDKRHDAKNGYPPHQPYVYGQFQKNGKYVVVDNPPLLKMTNPGAKFIHVRDLRK